MSAADTAMAYEVAQVGKPYQWGATGPDTFDCSGLQVAGWKAAGVALPRTSYQQMSVGRSVGTASLAPGDLIFPHPGHVQLYLGNGMVVEAPRTGENVRVVPMGSVYAARRIADIPGQVVTVGKDSGGNFHVTDAFHIPNPLNIPGDVAGSVVKAVTHAFPDIVYNALFKPFLDIGKTYVWRAGMILLGGILLLLAVWMWKPAQNVVKKTVGQAQNLVPEAAA